MDIRTSARGIAHYALDTATYIGPHEYFNSRTVNNPHNNTYYYNYNEPPYYYQLTGWITHISGFTYGYFSRGGSSWIASVMWERTS